MKIMSPLARIALPPLRKSSLGAALVEYVILLAFLSIVAIASVVSLGVRVEEVYCATANALSDDDNPDCVIATGPEVPGSSDPDPVEPETEISLAAATLPQAMVGQPYSFNFSSLLTSSGTINWQVGGGAGALPTNMTLDALTGFATGTPVLEEDASFEIVATDGTDEARMVYTIRVGEAILKVLEIAVGTSHTCAITEAGPVACWGANAYGSLGVSSATASSTVPVEVPGLESGAVKIAADNNNTCVVMTTGAVKCWGRGQYGANGDGTVTDRFAPVDVVGISSGASDIVLQNARACAVMTDGSARCWGMDWHGHFSGAMDGTFGAHALTPVDVIANAGAQIATMTLGSQVVCLATVAGDVICWGRNTPMGETGTGSNINEDVLPTQLPLSGVVGLASGAESFCAVTGAGELHCWGRNDFAQLGLGDTTHRTSPVQSSLTGVADVAFGSIHTCALTTAGGVSCWGDDVYGTLGDGNGTMDALRTVPGPVVDLASGAGEIDASGRHTCVIMDADNGMKCWGSGEHGKLGAGNTWQYDVPHAVTPL